MINAKNTCILAVGLTADPELVADGKIAKLRLAQDYAGRDASNPEDKRGFFDAVAFKDDDDPNMKFLFGQIAGKKMNKGSQVIVVGSLHNDRYEDKDGNKRQGVVIHINAITYNGGGKREEEGGSEGGGSASAPAPAAESVIPARF